MCSTNLDYLEAKAIKLIEMAEKQHLICRCSSCPCVKDSYNDCSYNWRLSKSLNEINDILDKIKKDKTTINQKFLFSLDKKSCGRCHVCSSDVFFIANTFLCINCGEIKKDKYEPCYYPS